MPYHHLDISSSRLHRVLQTQICWPVCKIQEQMPVKVTTYVFIYMYRRNNQEEKASSKREFAERLKQERERRSWSQEQLAEMIGTTSTNVSRWERRITFPNLYFRQQLSELFGKSAEELGLYAAIPETSAPLPDQEEEHCSPLAPHTPKLLWRLPHQRNPLFTGREAILSRLHNQFQTDEMTALPRIQAISGMGGMGKTQTAIEYAYRSIAAYQLILWMRAETRAALVADAVALAEELHLIKKGEQKQDEAIKAVKGWLQERTGWLLILDNIEEFQLLREFLPSSSAGYVLLTTCALSTGPHIQPVDLDKMEPEEGALFLLRRARRLHPKGKLEQASPADRSRAIEISGLLDGLPLALDQAGAYIEETGCSLSHYANIFQHYHATLLGLRDLSGGMNADHPLSVSSTLSLSLERIKWVNPAALELLQLCAFLHSDAIPEELLRERGADLSPGLQECVRDPLKLDVTIADLRKYALLQRNPEIQTLSLHRLVQMVIRDSMNETAQRQWADRAVQVVNRTFPQVQYWITSSQCQRYFPQAQNCAVLIETWSIMSADAVRLLVQLARYCNELGLYEQVEALLRKALVILKHHEEVIYPAEAEVQQLLGWLYFTREDYEQAAMCFQQAVVTHEQVPEPDHVILAGCLADLAQSYFKQNKWVEAEPYCLRALEISERLKGPAPSSITTPLHNLGSCYRGQGKYTLAEPLLRQALTIHQEELGMEHPLTAISLNALGRLYLEQEQNGLAEPLLLQAVEVCQKALGAHHPQTLQAQQYLARCAAHRHQPDAPGQPPPAVSLGRGDRSPSRSQAHLNAIRVPCDQVGERSPGSVDDKDSPVVSGAGQPLAPRIHDNCEEERETTRESQQNESTRETRKHTLTDEQWAKIMPLLHSPKTGRTGRPAADHRRMIDGILWIEKTETPWRDLPPSYGKWQSLSSQLSRWRQTGVWQRILTILRQEVDVERRPD